MLMFLAAQGDHQRIDYRRAAVGCGPRSDIERGGQRRVVGAIRARTDLGGEPEWRDWIVFSAADCQLEIRSWSTVPAVLEKAPGRLELIKSSVAPVGTGQMALQIGARGVQVVAQERANGHSN